MKLSRSLVQLGLCFFAASACSGQSIWTEGWQAAQIRTYVVTDTTEDGIVGDRGGWIVYDSAPDCNGAPHPNTAEILSVGGNKILKMNVVPNDCVSDLSVDLFSSPNIPISTNTVISFTQTGTLSNPQWNGFFPTLFPPPGDSIHLSLLDQNKNAIVYIFQRTPQYPAHTTTLQVQFPDGHIGNVGYHEVFVDSHDATGGTYVRNLFQDFNQAPGFNLSGAQVSYIGFSISGVGTATFDNLQIESRITAAPEIVVEQPAGFVLANGSSSVDFGTGIVGAGVPRTFTIRNIGGADLTGVGITITGLHSNDFKLTAAPASQLPPLGGSTTFSVTFTSETIGERTALLRIANNDSDESPFDIMLKGTAVSPLQIAQQAYLKASNTGARDWFGFSVAASGDTVIVGARQEGSGAVGVNGNANDNSATNSGAAYVFVRNGTNWTQQAYLKASNTAANDLFGESVAISGDTVVVGARDEDSNATGVNGNQNDNSATGSGAAYVFVRSGTNWTQQAYLKASNTQAGDQFGRGVAISGDTIVVGAYLESSDATGVNGNQNNNSAPNSGAAYIFERSGTTWTQQAYLKASNTEAGDVFGHPVAISGDTVVIGAVLEDSNATGVNGNQNDNTAFDSGAVYVFVRKGTVWSQQAYLKASNTEADDRFGTSIGVSADTVVVGASWEDSKATGVNGIQSDNSSSKSGAAYVFVRNGSSWSQQAYLKASNSQADDAFGQSVAISSDTIVVGAFTESSRATGINGNQTDNSGPLSGAAYVFLRNDTNWTQLVYLKASNTESADFFGFSVAVSGNTVVVGAREEDSGSSGVNGSQSNNTADASGAGYVFDLRALASIPDIGLLDDFNSGNITVTNSVNSSFGNPVSGVFGGNRTILLTKENESSATSVTVGSGVLTWNETGADYAWVDYGTASTRVDLSGYDTFRISVDSAPQNAGRLEVDLSYYVSSNSLYGTYAIATLPTSGTVEIPFSSFVTNAAFPRVDFTMVHSVALAFRGNLLARGTYVFDNFQVESRGIAATPTRFVPSSLVFTPAGPFQFQLSGAPTSSILIQASSNLTQWSSISTNTFAADGTVRFEDSAAPAHGQRFYRTTAKP